MSTGVKRNATDPAQPNAKRTKKDVTSKKATVTPSSNFSKLADRKPAVKPTNKKPAAKKSFDKTKSGATAEGGKASGKPFNKFSQDIKFNKFAKDTGEGKPEKTDWVKYKAEKKELKLKRKQSHDLFELTGAAKKIYETLKCNRTAKKEELAQQLHNLIKDAAKKEKDCKTSMPTYVRLALAHDTARVVQCLLKRAPAEAKREISEILLPSLVRLSKSKYGLFCVMRLIKYGAAKSQKTRDSIFKAIEGSVVKLTMHQQAAGITDYLYVSYASATQKARMRQEFYGEMYKQTKDASVVNLADAYRDTPELKAGVLSSMKAHLNHAINKGVLENSLIHALLQEYLNECSTEESDEMIQSLLPHIAALCCTKDGSKVACMCLFRTPAAKDRRVIVKAAKEHLLKLVTHEHGHVLVVAIVNCLDDTKAIKKAIFDTLKPQLTEVMDNEFGRKVIGWFIAPEDKTIFHPQMIQYYDSGLASSKKSLETRRAEVLEAVQAECIEYFTGAMQTLFVSESIALWASNMLGKFKENTEAMFEKLAEIVSNPDWVITNVKGVEEKGVESAGIHMALKKLLKASPTFAVAMCGSLSVEIAERLLQINRGAFLLVHVFENGGDKVQEQLKELCSEFNYKEFNNPGAVLFAKKLEE